MTAFGMGPYGVGIYGYSTTGAQLTFTVELDTTGSAFGTAFSATDVTSQAVAGLSFEPLTVTWGRQDQFGNVNATTVTGSLLNTDGTYSPGNTSGTYYPHIRRGLRRRVSVTVSGLTTVNMSEDYATSLEVVPANDSPSVTNIEGADILARFGATSASSDPNALTIGTTLRTFLAEEMLADTPAMLHVLQEAQGATTFGNLGYEIAPPLTIVNSRYGTGTIAAGQAPAGTFAAGTVIDITNPNYGTITLGGSWLATTRPVASSPTTVEIWVQMPSAPPASGTGTIVTGSNAAGTPVDISVDSSGHITANSGDLASSTNLCDGKIHQIVLVLEDAASILYIDGASAATSATTPVPLFGFAMTVGMYDDGLGGANPFTGGVAYFAVYSGLLHLLSPTRVLAHYNAGATAFAGLETTDARITRLLSYRPNTGSNLDAGLSLMGLQDIAGRSLQDCLLEVGQVEAGVVYTDGAGRVTMRSRSRLFNPTVTATFDMSAGGIDFGSNWREDTQNVVNDVTITNSTTGSEQRFYNAASIALDGEFSTSLQLPVNTDAAALDIAGWTVANGTQQQLTATPLIINLLHLTADQAQAALTLAPLDCIQLTNCPTPAPASTMTFIVQGGVISLAADAASQTLNLTPLPPAVAVWDSTNWDAAPVWAF